MSSNLADLPLWLWHLMVKMSSNLADLPCRSAGRSTPWYWHLVVKMVSNLADVILDLLADLTPLVLTSHGQGEFKFGRSTPRSADRSTPLVLTSFGQDEFKFGRSTPRSAEDQSLPVLTSCGQDEFKFGRSTPRSAGRSIPPQYWHLVVKMSSHLADLPLDQLADLTPASTDIFMVKVISNLADLPPRYWNLTVKMSSNLADLTLDLLADLPPSTDILWSRWVQIWQIYP